jgi:hypothetical protein
VDLMALKRSISIHLETRETRDAHPALRGAPAPEVEGNKWRLKMASGKGSSARNFGQEICRFSSNGKTFFFNKVRARNDRRYVQINALFGDSGRERLTIFADQALEFLADVKRSVEDTFDITTKDEKNVIPSICPTCSSTKEDWLARSSKDGTVFLLACAREDSKGDYCTGSQSQEIIFENVKNAWDKIKKEMYDDSLDA